jgi:hypothetical protein
MSLATQAAKDSVSDAKRKLYQAERTEMFARYNARNMSRKVETAKSTLSLTLDMEKGALEHLDECESDVRLASANFKRRHKEFLGCLEANGETTAKYPKLDDNVEYRLLHDETPTYCPVTSPNHTPGCSPFHTPASSPGFSPLSSPRIPGSLSPEY